MEPWRIEAKLARKQWLFSPVVEKQGAGEEKLYASMVADMQHKWNAHHNRFRDIKRPYSAESVVSKRGTLDVGNASSGMGHKLALLLLDKAAKGEPVYTCKLNGTKHNVV